jgi:hypothetical protein
MPKLNTTIDKIELNSNKVINAAKPLASWTDTQYPSAKTLYNTYNASFNLAHPVGSIMITGTSTNPGDSIGGTWELVDKGFADKSGYLTSTHWTAGTADLTGAQSSLFLLKDHIISIRLSLTNNEALTDATSTLGTLNLSSLGISSLALSIVSDVTASDGGQCTISYAVNTAGEVTSTDVLTIDGKHSLAAGNTFSIHIMQAISDNEMLNSYCDKFWWKRTA